MRRNAAARNVYDLPPWLTAPEAERPDYPARLGLFLTLNAGSCFGRWSGYMPARDQRALFGRYLGKGRLTINGADERLLMTVTVCFGTDTDCREDIPWRDL